MRLSNQPRSQIGEFPTARPDAFAGLGMRASFVDWRKLSFVNIDQPAKPLWRVLLGYQDPDHTRRGAAPRCKSWRQIVASPRPGATLLLCQPPLEPVCFEHR